MTKLVPSNLTMLYDGKLEGFLTAVFDAYALKVLPESIQPSEHAQLALGQQTYEVTTDASKAERVRVGICNKAGIGAYEKLKRAFLAHNRNRERGMFEYVVLCMEMGRKVNLALDIEAVAFVERLAQQVSNEQEDMYQFVRFEELQNGVYLAVINPKNNVTPLIIDHFAARFNVQPFIIYDEVHKLAAVYDGKRRFFVQGEELAQLPRSASEPQYQLMWKTFYDSLFIEQRFAPDLRTNHLPKRFWKNLTEMRLATA